jgi:hypothetical protein
MSRQQGFSPGRLRVRRFCAGAGKRLLACFLLLGLVGSSPSPSPTPAEIVSSRFPSASVGSPVVPSPFSTASVLPIEQWEVSNPNPFFFETTAYATMPAAVESGAQLAPEQVQQPAAPIATSKPEPSAAQSTHAAARRGASRPAGVLNDAQIASIKRRLNLTPEQEKMWPAVEAALRKIVYTKNAMSPRVPAAQSGGERMAYIDPTSAEVQQLKYVALPLIKRLNEDQRREVKMMAYVMGLEELASQF